MCLIQFKRRCNAVCCGAVFCLPQAYSVLDDAHLHGDTKRAMPRNCGPLSKSKGLHRMQSGLRGIKQ